MFYSLAVIKEAPRVATTFTPKESDLMRKLAGKFWNQHVSFARLTRIQSPDILRLRTNFSDTYPTILAFTTYTTKARVNHNEVMKNSTVFYKTLCDKWFSKAADIKSWFCLIGASSLCRSDEFNLCSPVWRIVLWPQVWSLHNPWP